MLKQGYFSVRWGGTESVLDDATVDETEVSSNHLTDGDVADLHTVCMKLDIVNFSSKVTSHCFHIFLFCECLYYRGPIRKKCLMYFFLPLLSLSCANVI
jgi:hypothetical protein